MRLNAVPAASALLAASLLTAPALAGDRAMFNPLGFSPDGRYFAFEEYGVQDGSGFPYATIHAIDLKADKWAGGAPFAVRLEADGATLSEARAKAAGAAKSALATLHVTAPAEYLALNADGEGNPGKTLRFGTPGDGLGEPEDVRLLGLDTFPAAVVDTPCADYTERPTLGFALTLDDTELHRDITVPKSRGCALDYRLYGVLTPFTDGFDIPGTVVIVSVYPFGFEGPDRRFIAIPIDQP